MHFHSTFDHTKTVSINIVFFTENLHMSLLTGFRVEKDYKYNESEVLRYIAFLESKFSLIMIAGSGFG